MNSRISLATLPTQDEANTTTCSQAHHLDLTLALTPSRPSVHVYGAGCCAMTSSSAVADGAGVMDASRHLRNQSTGVQPGVAGGFFSPAEGVNFFVHPWSLAARQQKVAEEQALHRPASTTHHPTVVTSYLKQQQSPVIVGWPPVRASRRNLVAVYTEKRPMDGDKGMMKEKDPMDERLQSRKIRSSSSMFVKVNMEGFLVGRKINLCNHDGYKSLTLAIQRMITNFFCNTHSSSSSEEEEENADEANFTLLYEDHEGDRMLVGDVPWELFLASVKRLYIVRNGIGQQESGTPSDDGSSPLDDQIEEPPSEMK